MCFYMQLLAPVVPQSIAPEPDSNIVAILNAAFSEAIIELKLRCTQQSLSLLRTTNLKRIEQFARMYSKKYICNNIYLTDPVLKNMTCESISCSLALTPSYFLPFAQDIRNRRTHKLCISNGQQTTFQITNFGNKPLLSHL